MLKAVPLVQVAHGVPGRIPESATAELSPASLPSGMSTSHQPLPLQSGPALRVATRAQHPGTIRAGSHSSGLPDSPARLSITGTGGSRHILSPLGLPQLQEARAALTLAPPSSGSYDHLEAGAVFTICLYDTGTDVCHACAAFQASQLVGSAGAMQSVLALQSCGLHACSETPIFSPGSILRHLVMAQERDSACVMVCSARRLVQGAA